MLENLLPHRFDQKPAVAPDREPNGDDDHHGKASGESDFLRLVFQ